MKTKDYSGNILESIMEDKMRADLARERAITEYNIMMGNIEDPSVDDEENEEA